MIITIIAILTLVVYAVDGTITITITITILLPRICSTGTGAATAKVMIIFVIHCVLYYTVLLTPGRIVRISLYHNGQQCQGAVQICTVI